MCSTQILFPDMRSRRAVFFAFFRTFQSFFCLFLCAFLPLSAAADESLPAAGAVAVWSWRVEQGVLTLSVQIPAGIELNGILSHPSLEPETQALSRPLPVKKEEEEFFPGPGEYRWTYPADQLKFPLTLTVAEQACSAEGVCYAPKRYQRTFPDAESLSYGAFSTEQADAENPLMASDAEAPDSNAYLLIPDFEIIRSAEGYLSPDRFLDFLQDRSGSWKTRLFAGRHFLVVLLLILLGGIALNLTPCVLPLIPVNLAMIGTSGSSAEGFSRKSRILRGVCYGTGMMLCYGLLGGISAAGGLAFGFLNASSIFQFLTAAVFVLLALAMFDLLTLDLSRWSSFLKFPSGARYGGVFLMGALTALLAGACVAPVLAATLIQTASMVQTGRMEGLLLPFLLGLGMALPWPFLAAGISLFPKPGKWMVLVKRALGILILLLACHYAFTGFRMWQAGRNRQDSPALRNQELLAQALRESQETGRPILADCWATWCKNCAAMEAHTLSDPAVMRELEEHYIVIRLQLEDPADLSTADLMKLLGINGLPAFVIFRPL